MPIHFRCPSCFGLLSIARRKAGKEVACPKCGDAVIVPADDGSAEDDDPQNAEFEAEAASIRAAEPPSPPPEKLPPLPPREHPAAKKREPGGVATEPRSAPPPPPLERKTKPAPGKTAPGKTAQEETPLFERADFERLLAPAAKQATAQSGAQGAKGLTRSASPAPLAPTEADLAAGEKGIFISHSSAIMLVIMGFVLLGLAFAAGFLVGG